MASHEIFRLRKHCFDADWSIDQQLSWCCHSDVGGAGEIPVCKADCSIFRLELCSYAGFYFFLVEFFKKEESGSC